MKLNKDFITHETDGEQVMVALGNSSFSGVVRSNKTAAFIVDMLKNDVTREDIIKAMLEKYDAEEAVIAKDVDGVIAKLKGIGAIDE